MMSTPPLNAEPPHRRPTAHRHRPTAHTRAPTVTVSVALAALPAVVVALVSYPAVALGVLLGSLLLTTMITVRGA